MHQNNSNNICLLIPLVKHNFWAILFNKCLQNWQICDDELIRNCNETNISRKVCILETVKHKISNQPLKVIFNPLGIYVS